MTSKTARLCVIVATLGRPSEVADLLRHLAGQTRRADRIILSVTGPADLPSELGGAEFVIGTKGLCAQRNAALKLALDSSDIIAFFDDDYLPSRFALAQMELFFADHPAIAGATGTVLKDGIQTSGVSLAEAEALLHAYDLNGPPPGRPVRRLSGLYGCNMVYRTASIGEARFDEALPLYGWQEDVDFSGQVAARGDMLKTDAWAGVHRGVKGSRNSGLKFGYSQVANPIYLANKGTMPAVEAYALLLRNLIANHVRAFWPEPWVDRWGRVCGNWLAVGDLIRGSLRPQNILNLE